MSGGNPKKAAAQTNSLSPQARTASANGTSADLAGYRGGIAVLAVGVITDGTHTPRLEESDDNSTFTTVAAGDLEGSFAVLASNTNQAVGYKGRKRYIRVATTVAGATTGGIYGAAIVREGALQT